MKKEQNPILITGSHRSATTFIGKILNLDPSTVYVNEPFNPSSWSYRLNGLSDKYYRYVYDLNVLDAKQAVDEIIHNRARGVYSKKTIQYWLPYTRKGRKIFKDPIAAMSSEWLYKEFDMDVLITVRHPVAYVQSLKRLNWKFPFDHLLTQDQLMKDHLHVFRNEMMSVDIDFVSQAALSWKCIYYVLSKFIEEHGWYYVRHEDISLNPQKEFKRLYDLFQLQWSQRIEQEINKATTSKNVVKPKKNIVHNLQRNSKALAYNWKNSVSENEIKQIYTITNEVSERFYNKESWEVLKFR